MFHQKWVQMESRGFCKLSSIQCFTLMFSDRSIQPRQGALIRVVLRHSVELKLRETCCFRFSFIYNFQPLSKFEYTVAQNWLLEISQKPSDFWTGGKLKSPQLLTLIYILRTSCSGQRLRWWTTHTLLKSASQTTLSLMQSRLVYINQQRTYSFFPNKVHMITPIVVKLYISHMYILSREMLICSTGNGPE